MDTGTRGVFRPTGTVSRATTTMSPLITAAEVGRSSLVDTDLLDAVRRHNLVAFRQAWKRFEEAVPGLMRLVPQAEMREVIERDYRAMQGMILGDVPELGWVMDQLRHAEAVVNGT